MASSNAQTLPPLPTGDTIQYEVYLANANTDPSKANPVYIGTVENPTHTITLNAEGQFFVGVKAVRFSDGGIVSESSMGWSDNPVN